jgi:hypothetical protein
MTPEGLVKKIIKAQLAEIGWWYFMPPGTGYGRAGIPDFIGMLPSGRMFAIEAKATTNPTKLQQREIDAINSYAGVAVVIKGEAQAKDVLKILAEKHFSTANSINL